MRPASSREHLKGVPARHTGERACRKQRWERLAPRVVRAFAVVAVLLVWGPKVTPGPRKMAGRR